MSHGKKHRSKELGREGEREENLERLPKRGRGGSEPKYSKQNPENVSRGTRENTPLLQKERKLSGQKKIGLPYKAKRKAKQTSSRGASMSEYRKKEIGSSNSLYKNPPKACEKEWKKRGERRSGGATPKKKRNRED